MQVVVSTPGRFHCFHLAREMERHGALAAIFSAYPRFKLKHEGISPAKLHTYGWFHAPYMAMPRRDLLGSHINRTWEWWTKVSFDSFVLKHLPECDVFVGMSGSCLRSGTNAKRHGAKFVCDRGSAHIQAQDAILRAEYDAWGVPFEGIDPRIVDQEMAEYEAADCITVPSTFALDSFVRQGVAREKLRVLPYGVDLRRFIPRKRMNSGKFSILFVGAVTLQKGVQYLMRAYQRLTHPEKSLTLVGTVDPRTIGLFRDLGLIDPTVQILGHVAHDELSKLYAQSEVFVLPSVQDGFGMVIAEAMACGTPVIASSHTGGPDMITTGKDGYVVPANNSDAILEHLQYLADTPEAREHMGQLAAQKAHSLGGWQAYGDLALAAYAGLST